MTATGTDKDARGGGESSDFSTRTGYQALFDALDDAVCCWRPDTTLTFANRQYQNLFGHAGDQLLGQHWLQFVPEPERQAVAEYYRELAGNPRRVAYEHQVTHADGSTRWYRWTDVPLFDGDGRLQEFLSVGRDITDLQRAVAEMHRAETNYQALFDNSPAPLGVYDVATRRLLAANAAAIDTYGYSREEYLSLSIADLYFAEDLPALVQHADEVRKNPLQYSCSAWRHRRKDGSAIWVEVTGYGIEFQGRAARIIHVHDITDRKQLQDWLEQAQAVAHTSSWLLDVPNNVLKWSAETYRIFGLPPDEPLDLEKFAAGVHDEDRKRVLDAWAAALKGAPYDIEHRVVAGGEVKWVRERARIEFAPDGAPLSGVGTVQDITDLKRTELSLREVGERLEFALQGANDGLWDWNLETNEVYYSPRWKSMLGYAADELASNLDTWSRLVHPDDRDSTLRLVDAYIGGSVGKFEVEYRMRHKDGHYLNILSRAVLAADPDGRPLHPRRLVGTHVDLTEQKRAEERLRENTFFLRQSQTIGRIGGWRADPVTNTVMWTEGVYDLVEMPYDYRPDLETGLDFYLPDSRRLVLDSLRQTQQTGAPFSIPVEMQTRSGKRLWVEVRGFPHYAARGQIDYLMGTIQDITERREADLARERLQAQLQQVQKMEALGQLTGGIAHDFNNILAAILGYTGLALERFAADRQGKLAEYLLEVQKAGERARDLILKMLAFSRSHTAERPEPIDPQILVHEVVKMLRPAIPSSIALATRIAPEVGPVLMDAVDLHQMLTNLIINARDAVGASGQIEIELAPLASGAWQPLECAACRALIDPGRYVELRVSDNGHGIPAGIMHRIFDPFFTTKETGRGSGMGLAVVHGLVHRHGGHLLVESGAGKGTTFRLLFPAAENER